MPVTHKLIPAAAEYTGFKEHIGDVCKLYGVRAVFEPDFLRLSPNEFQETLRIKILPAEKQRVK